MVTASLALPWALRRQAAPFLERSQTLRYRVEAKALFPAALSFYGRALDRLQHWMAPHGVGARVREHRAFAALMKKALPPRDWAAGADLGPLPMLELGAVGLAGWRLPDMAILDRHGLNDPVVARHGPPTQSGVRMPVSP